MFSTKGMGRGYFAQCYSLGRQSVWQRVGLKKFSSLFRFCRLLPLHKWHNAQSPREQKMRKWCRRKRKKREILGGAFEGSPGEERFGGGGGSGEGLPQGREGTIGNYRSCQIWSRRVSVFKHLRTLVIEESRPCACFEELSNTKRLIDPLKLTTKIPKPRHQSSR